MQLFASCLVVFGFLVAMPTSIQSQLQQECSVNLWKNRPLNNLEILNDGNVIVGSKNRISLFNGYLVEFRHYSTCETDTCDNINKVMIVNDKDNELVICGTGKKGKCEVLGLPWFDVLLGANVSAVSISTDINRPAIAGIPDDGTVMFAVTNGPGATSGNIYGVTSTGSPSYPISKRKLKDLSVLSNIKFKESFQDFTIYYKDVFHNAKYSYFVTNQNKNGITKNARKMISKVARVCSHDEHELKGYVDFEIGCWDPNGLIEFNIIQHVTKIETSDGKVWVIGFFTNDIYPVNFICAATLTDVDVFINKTWDDFVACNDSLTEEERYLTDNRSSCDSSELEDRDYKFCRNHVPSRSYNIGLRKLNMAFINLAYSYQDMVTAVNHAYLSNEKYPVLLLGTSSGKLKMLNIKPDGDTLDISQYFEYPLNSGVSVTAIKQKNDDILYVTTETKLHKLVSTKCSEFTTCQSTMDGKNPLCGWCVLKNNATRHGECGTELNEWLPAIEGNCPSLSPSHLAVHIDTGVPEVTIGAVHIPASPRDYQCVFVTTEKQYNTSARREGDNFNCSTPSDVKTHTEATLELKMSGILIGNTSVMFYVCDQLKKCGDCDGQCWWDNVNLTCHSSNSGLIVSKNQCPQLKGNQTFFTPSGQETRISLEGSNLLSTYVYKCLVTDTICVNATLSDGNVNCSIKLQTDTNETEKQITVKYWLSSSPNVKCSDMISIDEVAENRVIVYNCNKLAQGDCSNCCGLKKEKYTCSWDINECVYSSSTSLCSNNANCPPPYITKLAPMDGPTHGGTILTLTGQNFGHWDVKTPFLLPSTHIVKIGDQNCKTSAVVPDIDVKMLNEDLTMAYPIRILCTVPATNITGNHKQNVTLKIDGILANNQVTFEYKTPKVEKIIPNKGPESGKTLITILGENIDIGNKRVYIEFDKNVECTDVKFSDALGVKNNITCLTGKKGSSDNKQKVQMYMETIYTIPYGFEDLFEYAPDPNVTDIDPKKGTLSGGTLITVKGENLDNAGAITLGSNEFKSMKVVCTRKSSEEARCPVPKTSDNLRKSIMESLNISRRNRSTDGGCTEIPLLLYLDGVTHTFNISYCRDPELEKFNDGVLLYKSDDKYIKIKGNYLCLAAEKEDYKVTVGLDECEINKVTATEIICNPPEGRHANPVVNVTVGNICVTIGKLEYDKSSEKITAIIAGTVLCVILIIVIGVVVVCFKLKGGRQSKKYETNPKNMEMEITDLAKQAYQEQETSGEAAGYSTFSTGIEEETKLLLQDQNLLIDRSILDKAELLGAGHFGSVYKGYLKYPDEKEDMLVAVKTLHQNSPREIDVQAFLKEAIIMKDFNHPNVLNLIGICLGLDDMPLVVLPYMTHGDLLTYIRNENNALTIKDLMTFSIDIAEGMTYLSELKFVHRDLACRNCMLNEDFRVEVADFGLSRDVYETYYYASESKKTMLPVKWMALECLEEGKYSSKSDVWSFGIVLWELMTRGVNPYPGVDNRDIVRYLEHGNGRRMPQPQYCPDALYTIMRNCWHPSAKFRPKFSQLAHEIKDMISLFEQAMKQGEHTANIQSTYVNIDNCTDYHYTDELMPTGSEVYDLDSAPTSPTSASTTGVTAGDQLLLTGSEEYDTDSAPTSPTSATTTILATGGRSLFSPTTPVLAAGDADSSQPTNNHDTTNAKSVENASNDTGSSEAVNTNDNIDKTREDDKETEVRAEAAGDCEK